MTITQTLAPSMPTTNDAPLTMTDLTFLLFGHAAFQYLHAGSVLGVFEMLAESENGLTQEALAKRIGLDAHPARCLLFGLVALRLIRKVGSAFVNSFIIDDLISTGGWDTVRDTIAFEAEIVYPGQMDFVASLRANRNLGLARIPGTGGDLYRRLAENTHLQQVFFRYMSSWSAMSTPLLFAHVDFGRWRQILDVGGGDATIAVAIAERHQQATLTVLELSETADLTRARIARTGLADRITVLERDMFVGPFPSDMDCVLFIHQLVIWPLEQIRTLLQKAYEALVPGGSVVIFSSISDDDAEGPLMAALDTAYFVSLPATRGMIYSWSDYETVLADLGFVGIAREPCNGWTPHGVVLARKPGCSARIFGGRRRSAIAPRSRR